eukprot:scaffold14744_cov91-Isochrysis_galbana.AAC.2
MLRGVRRSLARRRPGDGDGLRAGPGAHVSSVRRASVLWRPLARRPPALAPDPATPLGRDEIAAIECLRQLYAERRCPRRFRGVGPESRVARPAQPATAQGEAAAGAGAAPAALRDAVRQAGARRAAQALLRHHPLVSELRPNPGTASCVARLVVAAGRPGAREPARQAGGRPGVRAHLLALGLLGRRRGVARHFP